MNVLVAGDFCPQKRVIDNFEKRNYVSVLFDTKEVIEKSDYSIVNLECPVIYGDEKKILKQGPSLHCSKKGVEAVKWSGFECVTLANNHFRDYGDDGVKNTIAACSEMNIDTVGGGLDITEASKILYKQIERKTLAIINCCEHEFSIATETTAGSNPLNPIHQYYSIQEARAKADFVLVIVHGGHEMWQLPSSRMVETYRFFVDAGADAVVNHHQHCFSGYEIYNGKPIVYGLGNFCFDRPEHKDDIWNYGYMVMIDFGEKVGLELIPYKQCGENAKVELLRDKFSFEKEIEKLNNIISTPQLLQQSTDNYYSSEMKNVKRAFEPFPGSILERLQNRNLLPSFVTEKQMVKLRNMICCEAHRDKTEFFLFKETDND